MSKVLMKLTVHLTEKAWQAMRNAAKITGETHTDCLNRAAVMYEAVLQTPPGKAVTFVDHNGKRVALLVVEQ